MDYFWKMEQRKPVSVDILDTTLRDGAQTEGVSFSVNDKLAVFKALSDLHIRYVEAGNPGSNPKDQAFFKSIQVESDSYTRLCAFGSTKRKNKSCEEDNQIQNLLLANTPTVVIFGKVWDFEAREILQVSLEENLQMIKETILYLKSKQKEVIFDAEHFFEAYMDNKAYAFQCLITAQASGASCVCLCDTNGTSMPEMITQVVWETLENLDTTCCKVGIHCHNDSGLAVANTLAAVLAGATHIQGTFNGIGERCGNANLSTIVPNLQLKYNINCIPWDKMEKLTSTARALAEIENLALPHNTPYVGESAFAHKAGMHVDGMKKNSKTFEHVTPFQVGNTRRFLVSEIAGKSAILDLILAFKPDVDKNSPEVAKVLAKVKELENLGYSFEGAQASQELLVCKELGLYKPYFHLERITVHSDFPCQSEFSASSFIKIMVNGETEVTAAEGDGPVNAMDNALRKALEVFYPELKSTWLTDFKVRVLESMATASSVRVLIESSDGQSVWRTIGVSTDLIRASYQALVDSLEYPLMKKRLQF